MKLHTDRYFVLQFSAASLQQRIVDLEKEMDIRNERVDWQDEEITRLTRERDSLARELDKLRGHAAEDAAEHDLAVSSFKAQIQACNEQVSDIKPLVPVPTLTQYAMTDLHFRG